MDSAGRIVDPYDDGLAPQSQFIHGGRDFPVAESRRRRFEQVLTVLHVQDGVMLLALKIVSGQQNTNAAFVLELRTVEVVVLQGRSHKNHSKRQEPGKVYLFKTTLAKAGFFLPEIGEIQIVIIHLTIGYGV